jgi:hypothetical protein
MAPILSEVHSNLLMGASFEVNARLNNGPIRIAAPCEAHFLRAPDPTH